MRSMQVRATQLQQDATAAQLEAMRARARELRLRTSDLQARGGVRDSLGIESSPRLQRMEQAIESIAMEVEGIAEAQRFTTRVLAERHPDSAAPRVES